MKSVEFLIPSDAMSDSVQSQFSTALTEEFGGFTQRKASYFQRDAENIMAPAEFAIYEVVHDSSSLDVIRDAIRDVALPFIEFCGGSIEVKVDRDTYHVGREEPIADDTPKPTVSNWPTEFDVAIQTVIGPELHAVQDHFNVDRKDRRSIKGTIFYRGHVIQDTRRVSVVISCQNQAGNAISAMFAERMINQWTPKAIFLMGISAARRGKCKIGDVVTPRVIVNDTEGVAAAEKRLKRPRIFPPPHAMIQQLMDFRLDEACDEWQAMFQAKAKIPVAPKGSEDEYEECVAALPQHYDAAIYSSDLLLRDPNVLEQQSEETHQQIKIGEMEAAGFGEACNARSTPTPWFIVRGVSDFGDTFKNDLFHSWAAHAAASYLFVLIKFGIDIELFESS